MKSKISLIALLFFTIIAFVTNAAAMDRVVLKGSNNGAKSKLTQEMFYKTENGKKTPRTNTIFVIQSDFELAEDITIPDGCILEFEGGSLRNGRLNTNGCYVDAPQYQIFDNITFNAVNTYNGSLQVVDNIYVKVLKDDSFVNKKTNTVIPRNTIINRRYIYRITGKSATPTIDENSVIITIGSQKYTIAERTKENKFQLKYDYSQVIGISNKNGEMVSGVVDNLKEITFYAITPLIYSNNSTVSNKELHPEWFGAKGDNKNDDSYAFNTALDLANYSDLMVTIGNGVYRIDDALVVHTHTYLTGVVPTVEHPVKGCFSVNTDVAMLVFDKRNPSGSYILENFGFIPYSDANKSKYTGIKIYHSQNHARISGVGFFYPKTGIEVDAIGGVQLLRCEDISLWGDENNGTIALSSRFRLGGWYNANYFRPAFIAHSTVVKHEGGGDNTLDGGSTETNSYNDYLIELDQKATLIVRGGLYKETGRIARLRNSSKLIIEGDSYLYGNIDCDESSLVVNNSRNIQSRQSVINNDVVSKDVVIAHYQVFPKKPSLWIETISGKISKPSELGSTYQTHQYNGRLYTTGKCVIPTDSINLKGKTIALRIISPAIFNSSQRSFPLALNPGNGGKQITYSQGLSTSLENTSIFYAPGEKSVGVIERGERYIFIPANEEYVVSKSILITGNQSLMISDIYIIDEDVEDIAGNEELRIMTILSTLDSYVQNDGFLYGYNKGASFERPKDLTKEDEGFEFFDTTLHKPVYWTGDKNIGDKGWIDATGMHPNL